MNITMNANDDAAAAAVADSKARIRNESLLL